MDLHNAALTLGIGTVVITHAAMVVFPKSLQDSQKIYHAAINLAAAATIVYGARLL